ncbi:copper-binding protein [Sphingobium sp. Ant17]|uniref:copper-binding protein n=1 Tax=Sphingobium sp. Ant17 TaxID=1461752 RepID=UPI0004AF314C|nr:copper-binding protein [Sphingobium sp. Ant17]
MRALRAALFTAAILAAGPGFAQSMSGDMKGMSGMAGMDKKAPAAKTGQGVGVITAIDAKANKLTIQHGPIPAVGWPAMTVAFKANPRRCFAACGWASGSGSTSRPKAWPPRSLPFDRNRDYLREAGTIWVRPPRRDVLQE